MKCPVCGNDTFDDKDYKYQICEECFWEYDVLQLKDPTQYMRSGRGTPAKPSLVKRQVFANHLAQGGIPLLAATNEFALLLFADSELDYFASSHLLLLPRAVIQLYHIHFTIECVFAFTTKVRFSRRSALIPAEGISTMPGLLPTVPARNSISIPP